MRRPKWEEGREIPKLEPTAEPKRIELEVELITRLFGGGAVPRSNDEISWLRSAAVKSAIRSWWRAGRAHDFASIEDLRAQEEKLFGAQARYGEKNKILGGQGILSVVVEPKTIATKPYSEPAENPLNGAYFPALGMNRPVAMVGTPGTATTTRVSLTLKSHSKEPLEEADERDILLGLKLWLTLGGAGARTRRSAGALSTSRVIAQRLELPTTRDELCGFLREHCTRRPISEQLRGVFGLARARSVWIGSESASSEEAHKKLLEAMREARQDRPHPRNWKSGDWGRSRWPEADAIRFKAARTPDGSEWSHVPHAENKNKYPRIARGLPIVVHYMTRDNEPPEPRDHRIYGARPMGRNDWKKIERFASPILLRVVRVWRDGAPRYVPIAIFTDCTLPMDTRPLVTRSENSSVDRRDVVEGYSIVDNANATLTRVEKKFQDAGFEKLQEKP